MKRTAIALNHLISTRFRSDELHLIAFGRYARSIDIAELTGLQPRMEQGTNLHHALLLAGRHLRRFPNAQPVVLVVTDGEPTAHLDPSGEPFFFYPPHPQTIALTVRELDHVARLARRSRSSGSARIPGWRTSWIRSPAASGAGSSPPTSTVSARRSSATTSDRAMGVEGGVDRAATTKDAPRLEQAPRQLPDGRGQLPVSSALLCGCSSRYSSNSERFSPGIIGCAEITISSCGSLSWLSTT